VLRQFLFAVGFTDEHAVVVILFTVSRYTHVECNCLQFQHTNKHPSYLHHFMHCFLFHLTLPYLRGGGAQGTQVLRPQFGPSAQPRQTSWSEKYPRGFCKPQENCPVDTSDVRKATMYKVEAKYSRAKAMDGKAKTASCKAKDLGFKAKVRNFGLKTKAKAEA